MLCSDSIDGGHGASAAGSPINSVAKINVPLFVALRGPGGKRSAGQEGGIRPDRCLGSCLVEVRLVPLYWATIRRRRWSSRTSVRASQMTHCLPAFLSSCLPAFLRRQLSTAPGFNFEGRTQAVARVCCLGCPAARLGGSFPLKEAGGAGQAARRAPGRCNPTGLPRTCAATSASPRGSFRWSGPLARQSDAPLPPDLRAHS